MVYFYVYLCGFFFCFQDGRIDYGEFVAMMTKGNGGIGRRTMRNSVNISMRDSPRAARDSPRAARDSPRAVWDSPRAARDSPRAARDSPRAARDSPRAYLQ